MPKKSSIKPLDLPVTIKPYDKVSEKYFSVFYNKAVKSKILAYRNGKGRLLTYKKLEKKVSLKKQKSFLLNRVKENFSKISERRYDKNIVTKDIIKPKKARKTFFIQSTLKYHVFIYQKGKNKKKTENLVIGDADFIIVERDLGLKSAFAMINEEVKFKTGYDLKTYLGYKFVVRNLYVEGGFRLKKFKVYPDKEKLYYDKEISFKDL